MAIKNLVDSPIKYLVLYKMTYPSDNMKGTFHNPSSYQFINPMIAIGDWTSCYGGFDIVVNLNFPYHPTPIRQIHRTIVYPSLIIYTIGLEHDPAEIGQRRLTTLINVMIPSLFRDIQTFRDDHGRDPCILFHCYAGMHRSAALAIAFMMAYYGVPLQEVVRIVQSTRFVARPTPGFMRSLQLFDETLEKHKNERT